MQTSYPPKYDFFNTSVTVISQLEWECQPLSWAVTIFSVISCLAISHTESFISVDSIRLLPIYWVIFLVFTFPNLKESISKSHKQIFMLLSSGIQVHYHRIICEVNCWYMYLPFFCFEDGSERWITPQVLMHKYLHSVSMLSVVWLFCYHFSFTPFLLFRLSACLYFFSIYLIFHSRLCFSQCNISFRYKSWGR